MYPTASLVEAIPDIDSTHVLEESYSLPSLSSKFDPEDDSSGNLDFCECQAASQNENFSPSCQESDTRDCAPDSINQSVEESIFFKVDKGQCEQLRGAKEMLHAMQVGFLTGTQCLACSSRLFCIADAALVLCPECRMISPTHTNHDENTLVIRCHGVGLGVRA